MSHPVEDVLEQAFRWARAGRGVALATVIKTWGSAPRPVGAQLALDEEGRFVGSVSGGCIEAAVVHAGLEVLTTGACKRLAFGVSDDEAWGVGLACGGQIEVFVEPIRRAHSEASHGEGSPKESLLQGVLTARAARTPIVWVTELSSGQTHLASRDALEGDTDALSLAARRALDRSESVLTSHGDGIYFLHVLAPAPRLIVIGAVHIAQFLAPLARLNGFEVSVIDPRSSFATLERFPDVRLVHGWPHRVLPEQRLDGDSALVTLTHDPKLDDPALCLALESEAFYVGALGSRRTHQARVERLRSRGFSEQQVARIHGPVGLDIGAVGPAEIATSIIADLIATRRKGRTSR